MKNRLSPTAAWSAVLLLVGCLSSLGYVTGIQVLRGIGAASVASPLPLVFSSFRGMETFASDFFVEITTRSGQSLKKQITPELYSRLQGPYNRRNVYGAVFSYGPMFEKANELAMRESVLRYAFCDGPLSEEFGLPKDIGHVVIMVMTKTFGRDDTWSIEVNC